MKKTIILALTVLVSALVQAYELGAPTAVRKTDSGWQCVWNSHGRVYGNRIEITSAGPAISAWDFYADSWCLGHGGAIPVRGKIAANLSKMSSGSYFTLDVASDAEPVITNLALHEVPLADEVDASLLRVVQQKDDRVFIDFGRETAVRGIFLPKREGLKIYGDWNPSIEKEEWGGGVFGAWTVRDGKSEYEFHDCVRARYFVVRGDVKASELSFDVVPYGYAKHITDETWEQKLARMQWWTEARFGMFIHFGLYALPAQHEWNKSKNRIPDSKYDDYFKNFNPDQFDAKAWAKAAKDAGMKYAVLTTRHHEGFSLFDTKYSDYKITNTPFKRDLVKEFVEAFRAEGLKVGFYYSLLDWHHPDYTIDRHHPLRKVADDWSREADLADYSQENAGRDMAKYREFMKNQVTELLTNYGKIDIIWFDFSFPCVNGKTRDDWDSIGLLKLAKSLQPNIIIDNRLDLTDWEDGWDFATPEQTRPFECVKVNGRKVPWETCQTFSGSWGYYRDEKSWKSAYQCIEQLISTVSMGGNVLMNVGPTARGTFDYRALERLSDYGKWLQVNGDSIYGCTETPAEFVAPPNTILTYNPTTKRLYMHILSWHFGTIAIPWANRVAYAQLLNDRSELELKWNQVFLPVTKPPVEIPVVEFILK